MATYELRDDTNFGIILATFNTRHDAANELAHLRTARREAMRAHGLTPDQIAAHPDGFAIYYNGPAR